MSFSQDDVPVEQIRTSLKTVCQSKAFANSGQLCAILTYLIEETLSGRGEQIKAYNIGVDALGRESDFDPTTDSIVRAQIHRLRTKLRSYYAKEGKNDTVRIEIPLSRYKPKFTLQSRLQTPPREIAANADWRPGILVKPLTNQSPENGYAYFSEGLAESLAVALSKFQDIDVISHYSTGLYDQEFLSDPHPRRHARFILDGSYQVLGRQMRVLIKLTDNKYSKILWSDSIDMELNGNDWFALEDKILSNVLSFIVGDYGLISQHIFRETKSNSPENLSIYEAILRYHSFTRKLDITSLNEAQTALEKCLERHEPCPALVYAALAELYISDFKMGLDLIPDALNKAETLINKALELDYRSQAAHLSMANLCFTRRNKEELDIYIDNVINLNPNNYPSVAIALDWYARSGDLDDGCARLEALYAKLNAVLPYHHYTPFFMKYYKEGEYERALKYCYYPGRATSAEMNDYYGLIVHHKMNNPALCKNFVERIKNHSYNRKMRRVFQTLSFFDDLTDEFIEILKIYGLD